MRIKSEWPRLLLCGLVAIGLSGLLGCRSSPLVAEQASGSARPAPCSADWNSRVEALLTSGDGHGHGPDIGSDEWQSVMEFKLGLRGDARRPERGSAEWCTFIDQRIPWPVPQ